MIALDMTVICCENQLTGQTGWRPVGGLVNSQIALPLTAAYTNCISGVKRFVTHLATAGQLFMEIQKTTDLLLEYQ